MRDTYKIVPTFRYYFVTSTIIEWMPIFINSTYCDFIINTIRYFPEQEKIKVYGFVILPHHFHLIISTNEENSISKLMQSIKKFTAKLILEQLQKENKITILQFFKNNKPNYKNKSTYQIWQEGFHPIAIQNIEMFKQKLDYIHFNPIKIGLVDSPEDWVYSSVSYYYENKKSLLEIDEIV